MAGYIASSSIPFTPNTSPHVILLVLTNSQSHFPFPSMAPKTKTGKKDPNFSPPYGLLAAPDLHVHEDTGPNFRF